MSETGETVAEFNGPVDDSCSTTPSTQPSRRSFMSKLKTRLYRNKVLLSVISMTFILANVMILIVDGPFSPSYQTMNQSESSFGSEDEAVGYSREGKDGREADRLLKTAIAGHYLDLDRLEIPPPIIMKRPVKRPWININWWLVKRILQIAPIVLLVVFALALVDYRVVSVWVSKWAEWAWVRVQSNWHVVKSWIRSLLSYFEVDLAYRKVVRLLEVWGVLEK